MIDNSSDIKPIEHWLSLDYWTVWEATILIHYGDPRECNDFGSLIEELPDWYEMLKRAFIAGKLTKLTDHDDIERIAIGPKEFINWLHKKGEVIDEDLLTLLEEGIAPINSKTNIEYLKKMERDKIKIQTMGRILWASDKTATIASLAKKESVIKNIGLNRQYEYRTYCNWLREVDSRDSKGKFEGRNTSNKA